MYVRDFCVDYDSHYDPHYMVREFHHRFGHPIGGQVRLLDEERELLRYELIKEEFNELRMGIINQDPVEIADALGDLVYVVYGMAIEMGIDLGPVMEEIHRSNMSKLGLDGNPIYREDGKVLKGPKYSSPNLRDIVK